MLFLSKEKLVLFILLFLIKCNFEVESLQSKNLPRSIRIMPQMFGRNIEAPDIKDKVYLELNIVCDFYCYQRHLNILGSNSLDSNLVLNHIQAYHAMIISLTNKNFKNSFLNVIEFEMIIKNYTILTTENSSAFSTSNEFFMKINDSYKDEKNRQYLDCDLVLIKFNEWLTSRINIDFTPILNFDLAIVFTYANIYSKQNDILGLSIIGGACTFGINGIVIEDDGSFSSSKTLAHEIAHR